MPPQGSVASSSSSSALTPSTDLSSFPKLLANDVDDSMDNHKSFTLVQALADYHTRMLSIEEEFAKLQKEDTTFHGYSSDEIASAFQKFASSHGSHSQELGTKETSSSSSSSSLPTEFLASLRNQTSSASSSSSAPPGSHSSIQTAKMTSLAANTGGNATIAATLSTGPIAYSWASLLMEAKWARVIYCVFWIVSGLILLFFGHASLYWLNRLGQQRESKSYKHEVLSNGGHLEKGLSGRTRRGGQKDKRRSPLLSGGIGGLLIGFLFFSYLAAIVHNALCADEGRTALSPASFFATWLLSGLLGAVIGGYFYFVAKVMLAILGGGACLTLILTAMFGVQSMLVRVILLAILASLLTAPMLTRRVNPVQKLSINASTSCLGIVTFLNGVALFAPSVEASSNWIDLWTILFLSNGDDSEGGDAISSSAATRTAITHAWGSPSFKGYIAGAVLGAVVGFLFEFFLHAQSGHDAESEWNEYLGAYSRRSYQGALYPHGNDSKAGNGGSGLEMATSMAAAARAGLFEPAPNAWQRMVQFFDSEGAKPAHYGNLSGDAETLMAAEGDESLTQRARRKKGETKKKSSSPSTQRGKTTKDAPARFTALSKRDEFDDESSGNDDGGYDYDEEKTEFGSDDDEDDEKKDVDDAFPMKQEDIPRSSDSNKEINYGGYRMPPPPARPSLLTASSSQLSGTTLRESLSGSRGANTPTRVSQERRSTTSPAPSSPSSSPSSAAVPATPSLLNAISRIQAAQQAAQAWQREHSKEDAPYNKSE